MSLFGIGPMELVFILIIMILVLGPKNMVTSAQKLGVTLRKIVKSPFWATVMDTSREIREIPTRLIREAGMEEDIKNIKSTTDSLKNVGNFSVPIDPIKSKSSSKADESEKNTILPQTTNENLQADESLENLPPLKDKEESSKKPGEDQIDLKTSSNQESIIKPKPIKKSKSTNKSNQKSKSEPQENVSSEKSDTN